MTRTPAIFVSHGAPDLAIQRNACTRALESFGSRIGTPRAAVVVSAHWVASDSTGHGVRVGASESPRLIRDFGGFDPSLYTLEWNAQGDPDLASRVASSTREAGVAVSLDPDRGLDHGVWVPGRILFPDGGFPVIPVSVSRRGGARTLLAVGRALSHLRDDGVLLLGTGGIVHNLGRISFGSADATVPAWANEFDRWFADRLHARDIDSLLEYDSAPGADLAVPTPEHFEPVLFALGAMHDGDEVEDVFSGFMYGTLSMRSFALRA